MWLICHRHTAYNNVCQDVNATFKYTGILMAARYTLFTLTLPALPKLRCTLNRIHKPTLSSYQIGLLVVSVSLMWFVSRCEGNVYKPAFVLTILCTWSASSAQQRWGKLETRLRLVCKYEPNGPLPSPNSTPSGDHRNLAALGLRNCPPRWR